MSGLKMKGFWDEAVASNARQPANQQKRIRKATIMLLETLKETMGVRENQRWTTEPIRELDKGLRQVRVSGGPCCILGI